MGDSKRTGRGCYAEKGSMMFDRLFNKSLHFYHFDAYTTYQIELNAFEALWFDYKHYGFSVAWHNFMWIARGK